MKWRPPQIYQEVLYTSLPDMKYHLISLAHDYCMGFEIVHKITLTNKAMREQTIENKNKQKV